MRTTHKAIFAVFSLYDFFYLVQVKKQIEKWDEYLKENLNEHIKFSQRNQRFTSTPSVKLHCISPLIIT